MQVNFFGTLNDVAQVWRWLFDVPDMVIFETCSRPGESNRIFETWEAIERCLAENDCNLAAWPRTVRGEPRYEKIRMDRAKPWHLRGKVRTMLRGPSIIEVRRNNDQRGCLAVSYLTCWNEKGARQRSIFSDEHLDDVDWIQFRSIFSKIKRRQLSESPARLSSYPIMADAFARLQSGEIKLWGFRGGEVTFPSPDIAVV